MKADWQLSTLQPKLPACCRGLRARRNTAFVDVKADHGPNFSKLNREGKADIAKADYYDRYHSTPFGAIGDTDETSTTFRNLFQNM